MDALFSEVFAARLQYVTFPLEVVGLTLALIELRYPKAAAYITQRIEELSLPLQALRSTDGDAEAIMERSLGALLSRLIRFGFFVLTSIYAVTAVYRLIVAGPVSGWLPGLLLSYVVSVVVMVVALSVLGISMFFLVVGGSDFARRFVAGRAIGTLGILIASLGLLGELYQFVTQLVN